MNHQPTGMRLLLLPALCGVCLLLTGSAQAQRSGARRAASARTASTSGTTTGTGTTTGSASSGSTTCPANGSSSGSGSTTTSGTNTTTGTAATGTTTTTTGTVSSLNSIAPAQTTALGNGTVSAVRTANNILTVKWTGDTSNIKTVYVAALNTSHQALQQKTISSNPVQATLQLTSNSAYYGVQIVYKDGSSNVMTAPIR